MWGQFISNLDERCANLQLTENERIKKQKQPRGKKTKTLEEIEAQAGPKRNKRAAAKQLNILWAENIPDDKYLHLEKNLTQKKVCDRRKTEKQ